MHENSSDGMIYPQRHSLCSYMGYNMSLHQFTCLYGVPEQKVHYGIEQASLQETWTIMM